MDVEERVGAQPRGSTITSYPVHHGHHVIQRYTIFLTDEDENDLQIQESEGEEEPKETSPEVLSHGDGSGPNDDEIKSERTLKRKRRRKKKSDHFENEDPIADGELNEDPKPDEEETERERERERGRGKKRKTPFPCFHCSYTSLWKTNLEKHMMAQHTGERPFRCQLCDYSAVHLFQLEKHWSTHHVSQGVSSSQEPHVSCPLCSFVSSDVEAQGKHMSKWHLGSGGTGGGAEGKTRTCRECGRRVVSLSALELHILERHPSVPKKHQCPHCPYLAVLSDNLQSHIAALHHCSDCSYWSPSLREVRRHKKKEHRLGKSSCGQRGKGDEECSDGPHSTSRASLPRVDWFADQWEHDGLGEPSSSVKPLEGSGSKRSKEDEEEDERRVSLPRVDWSISGGMGGGGNRDQSDSTDPMRGGASDETARVSLPRVDWFSDQRALEGANAPQRDSDDEAGKGWDEAPSADWWGKQEEPRPKGGRVRLPQVDISPLRFASSPPLPSLGNQLPVIVSPAPSPSSSFA